jgi:hypothetical protein
MKFENKFLFMEPVILVALGGNHRTLPGTLENKGRVGDVFRSIPIGCGLQGAGRQKQAKRSAAFDLGRLDQAAGSAGGGLDQGQCSVKGGLP